MWGAQDPFIKEIVHFSLCCRGITLVMQFVFNTLIPDHQADAFSPPQTSSPSFGDQLTELLVGGLGRWDAKHFLFIAEHGYLYEHNLAFFPLLPLSIAGVAHGLLLPLASVLSLHSRLLLSAVLLNCICFTLAAVSLYLLGCLVLQSRRNAFLAALLFCMNPASIFMTAAYSETVFALATFIGLWQLEKRKTLRGWVFLSFATAARANGLANVGFFLHSVVQAIVVGPCNWVKTRRMFLGSLVVILPFAIFQSFSYWKFCMVSSTTEDVPKELLQLGLNHGYRISGKSIPVWCSAYFPVAYSHIQSEYWEVGFLRYFQLHQVPNFFLAVPVVLLSSSAIWEYVRANLHLCVTLGLFGVQQKPSSGYCGPRVFLYIAHIAALMVFGVLCMHVQVLTRLLFSSSPVLFWFCSHRLQQNEPWMWGLERGYLTSNPALRLLRSWTSLQPQTKAVLGYFLTYWILGTALHVNFLPWT
ncbi:GPI mannosyltransferase 2 [Spea bombifrons]|uniref:GPI mannosyltransferase 2 n=1 Tax=Spea bombifrons TaxID=233779 RepID=UPI00234AF242|nr:GPI mannosyltransferase 2 [Spea bombifrons]XP_053310455.1 GPI mannosyltransferase 2 [Spea bombifrons]XP_053310456.1 GPI mannosyltransferase 2 [Spea bombifrons]